MGKRNCINWGMMIAFALASSACEEGGQTGQPSGGDPLDCSDFDVVPPLDCCRPVELDEPIDGQSAADILAAHGSVRGVPLFWRENAALEIEYGFEPEQSVETTLSLQVTLDDSASIQFCHETSLQIPVQVEVATADGFETTFSATWMWTPFFETGVSRHGWLDVAAPDFAADAPCQATFSFTEGGLNGRFCDEDRRLALFPTACGGVAQLPPDQASPYPELEAPSSILTGFENVTLTYGGLPPIALSVRIDDPSACYLGPTIYFVSADFEVETDGVAFTAADVLGYTQLDPASGREDVALRTELAEFCGDISQSEAWQEVAGAPMTKLCVTPMQTKRSDGTVSYAAEVSLRGGRGGWVFTSP